MKIPDNKLASIKKYFFQVLENQLDIPDVQLKWEYCCNVWLDMPKVKLKMELDSKVLSESEILKFLYGIKDLGKNRPVQYVTQMAYFYGLELLVEEGVLIPRPETEELVDWVVKSEGHQKKFLDIGTGSGCIPVAIKKHLPTAEVHAIDISEKALKIAIKNAIKNETAINFHQQDILTNQKWTDQPLDVIVSNPPYIPHSDKKMMQSNVLDFEPELALFVPNQDPLKFYKSIADFAKLHLSTNGSLYFEIHEGYGEEMIKMLTEKGFKNIELRKDLQEKDRMIRAQL